MAVACRWQHVHMTTTTLSWDVVPVDKPDDVNVVIGQAHFIKTVEDLHEAMVGVSSSLRFGLAFCEASGPRLVRRTGNDPELVELATRNAQAIADLVERMLTMPDEDPPGAWEEAMRDLDAHRPHRKLFEGLY